MARRCAEECSSNGYGIKANNSRWKKRKENSRKEEKKKDGWNGLLDMEDDKYKNIKGNGNRRENGGYWD